MNKKVNENEPVYSDYEDIITAEDAEQIRKEREEIEGTIEEPVKKSNLGRKNNYLDTVRMKVRSVPHIRMEAHLPRKRLVDRDKPITSFYCVMCGTIFKKQSGNFYMSQDSTLWRGNNGFLPFCKQCSDLIYEGYVSIYDDNEEHALKQVCALFDWYYSEEGAAMSHNTGAQTNRKKSRIGMYSSRRNTPTSAYRGTTYTDTLRDEQRARDANMDAVTPNEYARLKDAEDNGENNTYEVTQEMIRNWGRGFTPEQYRFLEEEYQDWITKNVCNSKSQEEIYRNITLAQLDVRIARERGGKIADAQDSLQKLMNSANILPKQTSENILADTQTFGTLIKKYEETDPIPEPQEKWKDVDGIRKYMNTWFRGGLAKALKISNDNAALYNESMKEYERYSVDTVKNAREDTTDHSSIFDQNNASEDKGGGSSE